MLKTIQTVGMRLVYGKEKVTAASSFYELTDTLIDGKTKVPMSTYKGDVVLVTNVASQWGLTKQNYTEFSKIVDEYGKRGLKVLAFPCNQFGGQEPGTPEEILTFVEEFDCRDKLTFFKKGDVNGARTREVFSFLKREIKSRAGETDIRWNFAKFLIDHEGKPYKRYGPKTPPFAMKDDIEELLKRKENS